MEVESTNRKIAATTALLTAFAIAAIMGGVLASQSSSATGNGTTTLDNGAMVGIGTGMRMGVGMGMMNGPGGPGGLCNIEVSEEYRQTVVSIAEGDADVQALIADGYNVTSVRPIITTTIDAEGYVAQRAASAVLTLQNGVDGSASVWVDVANGAVTKIVTLSRTVIDKTGA